MVTGATPRLVTAGLFPAATGARSVTEKLGIRYVLGRPRGQPAHRHGTRRSGSDHGVPVSRAQDGPDPRDPRTSDRRGRRDPHRRGNSGRDAAARRGQLGKAASVRVNHTGSSSQDPEHENLHTLVTLTDNGHGVDVRRSVARHGHQVRHAGPDAFCAQQLQAASDRS